MFFRRPRNSCYAFSKAAEEISACIGYESVRHGSVKISSVVLLTWQFHLGTRREVLWKTSPTVVTAYSGVSCIHM